MPTVGLIFDLGGVVIDWNPRHLYRKVFSNDERSIDKFLSEICPLEWNEKQDAGRSLAAGTAERIAQFPEWAAEIRAYYDRWLEMIGDPIPGTSEILGDLKDSGMHLFALSNWSAETFPLVEERFSDLSLFERVFLSAHYGVAKPESSFYEAVLSEIGIPRSDLIFVDDNQRNVAAAQRLGLPSILFSSAAKLRKDLCDVGLLD